MGLFNRKKTSDLSKEVYNKAFMEEHIRQSALKGKRDAQAQAGRSRVGMLLDTFGSNFKGNMKGKGKSEWGLPDTKKMNDAFGSYGPSGGKRGKKKDEFFGF